MSQSSVKKPNKKIKYLLNSKYYQYDYAKKISTAFEGVPVTDELHMRRKLDE
jgi:hypothetical protein